MASQTVNRDYDINFVTPPPPEVQTECPICLSILFQPKMATCSCGHSYCAACIGHVESEGMPCSVCGQQFTVVKNNWLERTLNGYIVYCPYKEKGCKWTGELGHIESHLNPQPEQLLEGCQFQEIWCRLCHTYQCERRLMTNHLSNECPNRNIECEYHYAGCDFRKPKQQLERHMKHSATFHLSLVSKFMQSGFTLNDNNMNTLKDEVRQSKEELRKWKGKVRQSKDELRKCKDEVRQSKDELRKCKDEVIKSKDELRKIKDDVRRSKDELIKSQHEIKQNLDGLLRSQRKVTRSIIVGGALFAILLSILVLSSRW